jgi:glycosyltransferase involved in cell wall biosynthesis
MVGFREPGYLWKLDIPFIWGPIGGMGYFPFRFFPAVGLKGAIYYLGYNCINYFHTHFLNRPRTAAHKTQGKLICATPENQEKALKIWNCNSTVMAEVGLPSLVKNDIVIKEKDTTLNIIWTGLHIPRKALTLALKGMYHLRQDVKWQLNILGKGSQTIHWQKETVRLGIADRCQFHGWLPRKDALEIMQDSHILLITSLRDLTSTVTVEALALGLPIICLDHCGFSHIVTPACGIKIPVKTPNQVSTDITHAIEKIWDNEPWRQELAKGALKRAQNFTWENKARKVNQIYREVIGKS